MEPRYRSRIPTSPIFAGTRSDQGRASSRQALGVRAWRFSKRAARPPSYIIILKGYPRWGFTILRTVLICLLAIYVVGARVASPSQAAGQANPTARHIDLALKGDLTGDGRTLRVEWYHREAAAQGTAPAPYVGLQVK